MSLSIWLSFFFSDLFFFLPFPCGVTDFVPTDMYTYDRQCDKCDQNKYDIRKPFIACECVFLSFRFHFWHDDQMFWDFFFFSTFPLFVSMEFDVWCCNVDQANDCGLWYQLTCIPYSANLVFTGVRNELINPFFFSFVFFTEETWFHGTFLCGIKTW